MTFPFPKFNLSLVEVSERINNFTPHCVMDVIIGAGIKIKPY